MFNKVSYRRGVIEGVVFYTLGRLGALITPAFFPGWVYVAAPLFFLALQFLAGPLWATRRMQSTKRERLSKRFWLLGPRMAAICLDRKSTRLNSSHTVISYAVFCLKKT